MKSNAYILSKVKGTRLTKPSFAIEQADIPFGSYYEVYGQLYLPIPKPDFPVGATLEFGIGETTPGVFAEDTGIPFKIAIDDPDFVVGTDDTWVEIFLSGDKLWRQDTVTYVRYLTEDPLGNPYKYDTKGESLKFIHAEFVGMTLLERLRYLSNERFWRCRLAKESGGTTYYSAMSETVSFNVRYKIAEQIESTDKGYPTGVAVDHERGLWFDGTWYYVAAPD